MAQSVSPSIFNSVTELYTTLAFLKHEIKRTNAAIHLVIAQGFYYPSNVLRNLAVDEASSGYVFPFDGDFVPSKHTE